MHIIWVLSDEALCKKAKNRGFLTLGKFTENIELSKNFVWHVLDVVLFYFFLVFFLKNFLDAVMMENSAVVFE